MLLTELNTHVLLHIYGCLDLIDSINLAETCTRLRDVAQLYYKRFKIFNVRSFYYFEMNRYRRNRIDAKTVFKHIGPFICDLEANLDENVYESYMNPSIRKYCVNVKSLTIMERLYDDPSAAYSDWLRKLSLTKISLSIGDLIFFDLSDTTTLHELKFLPSSWRKCHTVDYSRVADIFERNVNISCLYITLRDDFKYEIFEKLKCLKRLVLEIAYKSGGHLEKVATYLKMTALEKVEVKFRKRRVLGDGLSEFLQKLSENALHLKHLSIGHEFGTIDTYPLSSLHLLHLTSLRWIDKHPNLYKEFPKMQPNLTHLHLLIYEGSDLDVDETLAEPMEQIIFLIKNLEKLELLDIRFLKMSNISSTLKDFLQKSVLCRIFDCHSIDRPTVTLRLIDGDGLFWFVQVELDFGAGKWTWTTIKEARSKYFVEHQSPLPFYDSYKETIDDLLVLQRLSGTVNDLNSVKDEAINWIERMIWLR